MPGTDGLQVVAFGGGHGLAAALGAWRRITPELTAVVTVADDGGSSGRIRREMPVLPPGDLRMALAALADGDDCRRTLTALLQHRFGGSGALAGHSVGNLVLTGIAGEADLWIDTSDLNVHQLRDTLESAFVEHGAPPQVVATVLSFGFKYGLPLDADLVVDARFLPNPHWIPELRPHTGRDPDVRDYVLGREDAGEFLDRFTDVLRLLIPGYRREGKRYLTLAVGCTGGKHRSVAIAEEFVARWVDLVAGVADGYLRQGKRFAQVAIGCTGGKHRSVAMSEEIARRMQELGYLARALHRDLGRE